MTDAECAIGMCDGQSELKLWCPNGHYMHAECISMLTKSTYPKVPTCPSCRSDSIKMMMQSTAPSIATLFLSPHSSIGGVLAMRIGITEYMGSMSR